MKRRLAFILAALMLVSCAQESVVQENVSDNQGQTPKSLLKTPRYSNIFRSYRLNGRK